MALLEDIYSRLKGKGLSITKRDIFRVLRAYYNTSDFWEGVGISEVAISYVIEILKELERKGLVRISKKVELTEDAKEFCVREGLSYVENLCGSCWGRGIMLTDELNAILEEFRKLAAERPEAVKEYDQAYVTPETTVYRVALALYRGDVQNKRVIVLGDDDLVGLVLGMLKKSKRVTVVEIDERLLNFMDKFRRRLGIDIELVKFDLSDGIPSDMHRAFDTFFTDPPETEDAIISFVKAGVDSLEEIGGAGYFGVTRQESSLFKWMRIQRRLVEELGLVITDIIRNFSEYVAWKYGYEKEDIMPLKGIPEKNWFYSYLYRVELLARLEDKGKHDKIIYQDKENSLVL